MVTLRELVPKNHLLRKIDAAIDFNFSLGKVAHLYCHDDGLCTIAVLFKIMLLSYLFGVPSEHRLVQEIQFNVALPLVPTHRPDHLPPILLPSADRVDGTHVLHRIFDTIVKQTIAQGMVNERVYKPIADTSGLIRRASTSRKW